MSNYIIYIYFKEISEYLNKVENQLGGQSNTELCYYFCIINIICYNILQVFRLGSNPLNNHLVKYMWERMVVH